MPNDTLVLEPLPRKRRLFRSETATVRQFACATLFLAAAVGLFRLAMALEPVDDVKDGFVGGRPVQAATVFVGIAHFSIAFFYMWTSRGFASPRGRRRILLALFAGALLCALCHAGSGVSRLFFPSVFVGTYFILHLLRDEHAFAASHGDVPSGGFGRSSVALLLASLACLLPAVAWQLPFLRPDNRGAEILRPFLDLQSLQGAPRALAWLLPTAATLALGAAFFRLALRKAGLRFDGFVRAYGPLMVVGLGLLLLLCLGPRGEKALHLLVLYHAATWWAFTTQRLARSGLEGGPLRIGWPAWFRRTQPGFQTLHAGLTLAAAALAALWAYSFGRSPEHLLAWLVSPAAFSYWTIMHVTLSFAPADAPSAS